MVVESPVTCGEFDFIVYSYVLMTYRLFYPSRKPSKFHILNSQILGKSENFIYCFFKSSESLGILGDGLVNSWEVFLKILVVMPQDLGEIPSKFRHS